MKKYVVVIEETVVDEFEVEANDFCEALDIAAEKYRSGEFILSPEEPQFRQMAVVKPDGETTEWTEF